MSKWAKYNYYKYCRIWKWWICQRENNTTNEEKQHHLANLNLFVLKQNLQFLFFRIIALYSRLYIYKRFCSAVKKKTKHWTVWLFVSPNLHPKLTWKQLSSSQLKPDFVSKIPWVVIVSHYFKKAFSVWVHGTWNFKLIFEVNH